MKSATNWFQRVRYANLPSEASAYEVGMKIVHSFLAVDKTCEFAYFITFHGDDNPTVTATIEVFLPDHINRTLSRISIFDAGQVDQFKVLYEQVVSGNTTGTVDTDSNLLYNGAFTKGPNGLWGWKIDSQDGDADLLVTNGVLKVSDSVVSDIVLVNDRTTLVNLKQYKVVTNIESISSSASMNVKLGSEAGSSHTTTGIKNDIIVSGGTKFYLELSFTDVNQSCEIAFMILGSNP